MPMTNIVEFLVLFDLAFFFMVFAFMLRAAWLKVLFRFLTMITWFTLGVFYAGITTPTVPAVGFLFYIVGILFLMLSFKNTWDLIRMRGDVEQGVE